MARSKDSAFLAEARARFQQGQDADAAQIKRELEDLRVYAGDQWPKDILEARKGVPPAGGAPAVPARPALVIDKVRQPVRQVLNQAQASDIGIQLVPADDFAGLEQPPDPTEIELREGLVRRIQRTSEANDARLWALGRAVQAGRGYYGITTRYLDGKTFDQEVVYRRFYNQGCVTLDPTHEQPDGSDARWGFIGVDMSWDAYVAQYGQRNGAKNRVCTSDDSTFRGLAEAQPKWFTWDEAKKTRGARVVEYYYTTTTHRTVLQLADGRSVWEDEVPEGTPHVNKRSVPVSKVDQCILDGCDDDVLDETEWPSPFIPIIKVLGEELQPYDNDRRVEGMVRPATDSQRSFNYLASKFVEVVGLQKIPDVMMANGQDEGFEDEWNLSNTRTLSRLHYNNKDADGTPIGPPTSVPRSSEVDKVAMGLQIFSAAIKDTTATPDPSLGNIDPHLKSGAAIQNLVDQAQKGNSHYIDNWRRSISYDGKIVNSLLYPIYGLRPGRLARIVSGTDEEQQVILGQPMVEHEGRAIPFNPQMHHGQPVKTYKLTPDANFNVVVKVTKNADTRREQEASFFADIISQNPELMQVYGDIMFDNLDGPGHQQAAERARAMLAPPVQALLAGNTPTVQQAQQQIAQLTAQIQQLQPLADKNQASVTVAQIKAASDQESDRINAQAKVVVAEIGAKSEQMLADVKAQLQVLATLINTAKEERLAEKQHSHDALNTLHAAATDQLSQAVEHRHERDMQDAQQAHDAQQAQQAQDAQAAQAAMTSPQETA